MDRVTHKVEPTKIKSGDLMAFINYVKVIGVSPDGLDLETADITKKGSNIRVRGEDLIKSGYSADQYLEEHKVTKTDAARILINSPNRPLTVCFKKKDQSERTLRGRFIAHEELMGRSMVEDLDLDLDAKDDRIRQVDHRSILFLVVDGVKYTVK